MHPGASASPGWIDASDKDESSVGTAINLGVDRKVPAVRFRFSPREHFAYVRDAPKPVRLFGAQRNERRGRVVELVPEDDLDRSVGQRRRAFANVTRRVAFGDGRYAFVSARGIVKLDTNAGKPSLAPLL